MSVTDTAGRKLYRIKGRWLDIIKTRYKFIDIQEQNSYEMVKDHTFGNVVYSIFNDNRLIGSSGTNHTCSKGFIDIGGIGHAEMNLGHGLDSFLVLASSEEDFARITVNGQSWQIEIVKKCEHPPLMAGLAAVYGEYLRRD